MGGYSEAVRLVGGTELRAFMHAVRGEPERFEPPESSDPRLVDPVDGAFETVEGATRRLETLESRLRERGDRRAVFLTIYVRMTREVHDGIASGRFTDPEWMRRYLVTFANYYRRAFLAFETGDVAAVPDPWRVAFGASMHDETLVVQDAFLGVNAHINYDLALALADVGLDPDRAAKRTDHLAIDDILAGLVDAQQTALARLYAPGVHDVDALFGRLDESLTLRSMIEGRAQAWRVAVVRTDFDTPPVPGFAKWVLRTTATGGALFVLSPQLDPAVLAQLRAVERDDTSLDGLLTRLDEQLDARHR
ncbi:DUF5995 family protein [Haloarchaeobius salinus]|uniref:DUF5995 family protein n=1 Tax=Haloarchaeobius salinus TaxID=1198298 RepID=UPI00210A5FFC|nr:DUF5995 family protein [Haloarchaeobius salinus]